MKKSGSLVHVEEIFKVDTRHYYQGHRKVKTSCNVASMVTEQGLVTKKAE